MKLTIYSTFTGQGQLLLIDLQQDMVSVHNMFISFNTLCNTSNPNYIQLAFSQWNGLNVPLVGKLIHVETESSKRLYEAKKVHSSLRFNGAELKIPPGVGEP